MEHPIRGLVLALCAVAAFEIPVLQLALLCQRAELRAVGVPCGILDQAACLLGREAHAVLLDCHSLEHRLIDVPTSAALLIIGSGAVFTCSNAAWSQTAAGRSLSLRRSAQGISRSLPCTYSEPASPPRLR